MNNSSEKSSKEILQKENLRLLRFFKEVCDKNHIWYSLAYGSVLGAVRHNGIIPWDRDVDVYVKLKDVNRIRKIFKTDLPDNCSYIARGITKKYTSSHDILESKLVEGAHLDMYPLIGAPSNESKQSHFTKATFILRKLFKSKYVDINKCLPQNRKMVRIAKIIDIFIPDRLIEIIYKKFETRYDFNTAEYLVAIANYGKHTSCIKKKDILNTINCTFEDMECRIPKNYDVYLTQIYGDYMTPKVY